MPLQSNVNRLSFPIGLTLFPLGHVSRSAGLGTSVFCAPKAMRRPLSPKRIRHGHQGRILNQSSPVQSFSPFFHISSMTAVY